MTKYIQVPLDITNDIQLRQFLLTLVAKLDNARVEKQDTISKLNQTISATYVDTEVQAISNKVDIIIKLLEYSLILN